MLNKKFGFTLGEAIITLGVIGTIAALTLPGFLKNLDETKATARAKTCYSTFSNAVDLIRGENGGTLLGFTETTFREAFQEKMQVVSACSGSDDCWHKSQNWYDFSGNPLNTSGARNSMILLNRSLVNVKYTSGACSSTTSGTPAGNQTCGYIRVDTNGWDKPNTVGYDIFFFHIVENDILPAGTVSDKWYGLPCDYDDPTDDGYVCTAEALKK